MGICQGNKKNTSESAVRTYGGGCICTPCVLWALLYAPRVSCEGGCMHPVCLVAGWLYAPRVSGGGCMDPVCE